MGEDTVSGSPESIPIDYRLFYIVYIVYIDYIGLTREYYRLGSAEAVERRSALSSMAELDR